MEGITEGVTMSTVSKTMPVAVGGSVSLLDFIYRLPEVIPLLTALYLIVSLLHLLWKWRQEHKESCQKEQVRDEQKSNRNAKP